MTKEKLLEDALKLLFKNIQRGTCTLTEASDYLIDLDVWYNGPQANSIPPDPPPPPPGGDDD